MPAMGVGVLLHASGLLVPRPHLNSLFPHHLPFEPISGFEPSFDPEFRAKTKAKTVGFVGADQLEASLEGTEIVGIPSGVPRDDLFNINASQRHDLHHRQPR